MSNWKTNSAIPVDGQRVIAINHGGKGAVVGVFFEYYPSEYHHAEGTTHVRCALTDNEIWWEDVVMWQPMPEVNDED